MMAFLGMLPLIGNIVTALTNSFFNAKVAITQARVGGDRDVAVALVKASAEAEHENTSRLGIIASNKLLTFLLIAMAIPLVGFEWKVIVWDKMLGWGSTDPLSGDVSDWTKSVIYFLFGAPTVMGIGKMWFSRKTS